MKSIPFVLFLSVPVIGLANDVKLSEIQVMSHSEGTELVDFVPSVTQLKEKELRKRRQATVGDTLQSEAGVQSTSFGPNSSRPVIRGLDGARIKVLQNSLSGLDASTQSLDHNIPVDPMLVDQIEIVRGPMGLLYGSSAVGGVVNIVTNRTHSSYAEGFMAEAQTQGETVNNGISSATRVDYGINNWMVHVDASQKNLQETAIPGYARTKHKRETVPLTQEEEDKNKLQNSFNKQKNLGAGATKFFDKGHIGLSFGHFDNDYGSIVEKQVSINMLQNRYELVGEYKLDGAFKKLKMRSAQSDYRHKEIDDGVTGTIFKNKGNETRLEVINESGEFKGVTGVQSQVFNFQAMGDEAFLPETHNMIVSAFTFQEMKIGNNAISAGLRAENTSINKKSSDTFPDKDQFGFLGLNGSLGYLYKLTGDNSLSFNYSYTERAPTFQELLSEGKHVATGTYEIGNHALTKEKAQALELSFKHQSSTNQWTANLYTQKFHDYISLNPTGNQTVSDFDDYRYTQVNALFYGIDIDGKTQVFQKDNGTWSVLTRFDYIRAKDTTNNTNLPRISPPRVGLGLEYAQDKWTTDIEGQYNFEQTHTSPVERRTGSYFMTNIGTQYSFLGEKSKIDIFLRARNIFNVEARNHVSFLKEVAPLPGRNIILGLQWLI